MNNLPLSAIRGDTFPGFVMTISLNGEPVDLTGSTITMQIKKQACDDTAQLEFSSNDGITIIEPLSGSFQLDESIISIDPRSYVYDIQLELSSGKVITPVGGVFVVYNDVTR